MQHSQHDQSSSALQEAPNARYTRSAPNRQVSSSVNSIPLTNRKKAQAVTQAPPGPPKETCFFWYHGSCRRGNDCDRPHEAHLTWPIPPPPGFRHYQPCTLPLCPLRSDLAATDKPQEYQRRRRTIGGQMDGAAFSRATTAGESSSENDSNTNTDSYMSEANEHTHMISDEEILGLPTRYDSASQGSVGKEDAEGAVQASEVKAQEMGRDGFDESGYVDLSGILSPPSTPLVTEESLLSISHSGTLGKRRHSPATKSSKSSNKSIKPGVCSAVELENVPSILERPRKMSQWDTKPPSFGLDGQHSELAASYLAALHSFPPQPSTQLTTTNNSYAEYVPPPFDPPRGPRSIGTLPPICFFYYHKGYCRPKNGRRCDYLHDTNTSQQTVSLPHGIDNHDPSCPLPLCPIRLRRIGQVKSEPESFIPSRHREVKHEPMTPPRIDRSLFFENPDSSPRDLIMSVRGRAPKETRDQSLPQLTGLARERFKEQKHRIEQLQAKDGIGLAEAASTVKSIRQRQKDDQVKRKKKRGAQKLKRALAKVCKDSQSQTEEYFPARQAPAVQSDAFTTRQPLPSLSFKETTPTPAVIPQSAIRKKSEGSVTRIDCKISTLRGFGLESPSRKKTYVGSHMRLFPNRMHRGLFQASYPYREP